MNEIIDNSIKIVNGVEIGSNDAITKEVQEAVDTIIASAVEQVERQIEQISLSEGSETTSKEIKDIKIINEIIDINQDQKDEEVIEQMCDSEEVQGKFFI